ncbi:MAG: hypothetical protein FJ291_03610 [Planctomycetes bacterium]|nr:hypothetical protein [Planctomycetota bacterium]
MGTPSHFRGVEILGPLQVARGRSRGSFELRGSVDRHVLGFLDQFDLDELLGQAHAGDKAIVTMCCLFLAGEGDVRHSYAWQRDDGSVRRSGAVQRKCRILEENETRDHGLARTLLLPEKFGGAVFSEPVQELQFLLEVTLDQVRWRYKCAALNGRVKIIKCQYAPDPSGKAAQGFVYRWLRRD